MKIKTIGDCTEIGKKYGLDLGWHIGSGCFEIAAVLNKLDSDVEKLEFKLKLYTDENKRIYQIIDNAQIELDKAP